MSQIVTFSTIPLYKKGAFCYDEGTKISIDGRVYLLGKKLGRGGEGEVFDIAGLPDYVAKIYYPERINERQIQKIKCIVNANIFAQSLIAPRQIIYNTDGKFIGFIMKKVKGENFDEIFLNNFNTYTKKEFYTLIINVLKALDILDSNSSHQILMGDINFGNIQVSNKTDVFLIDLDSIQIDGFPNPVGTEDFLHPSIIGKHFPDFLRTEEHEFFAVAVLLFRCFIWLHPYSYKGGSSVASNITAGIFPYNLDGSYTDKTPNGERNNKHWKELDSEIRQAFYNVFANKSVVSIKEWLKIVETAYRKAQDGVYDPSTSKLKSRICKKCGKAFYVSSDGFDDGLCPECSSSLINQRLVTQVMSLYIGAIKKPVNPFRGNNNQYCKRCNTYISRSRTLAAPGTVVWLYCDKCRRSIRQILAEENSFYDAFYGYGKTIESLGPEKAAFKIAKVVSIFKSRINGYEDAAEVQELLFKQQISCLQISLFSNFLKQIVDFLKADYKKTFTTEAERKKHVKQIDDFVTIADSVSLSYNHNNFRFKDLGCYEYFKKRLMDEKDAIEKVIISKCSCCGREDRAFYIRPEVISSCCRSCLNTEPYNCPVCGEYVGRKPRYEIARLTKLEKFCSVCASKERLLQKQIAELDSYSNFKGCTFEEINYEKAESLLNDQVRNLEPKQNPFISVGYNVGLTEKAKKVKASIKLEKACFSKYILRIKRIENSIGQDTDFDYIYPKCLELDSIKEEIETKSAFAENKFKRYKDFSSAPAIISKIEEIKMTKSSSLTLFYSAIAQCENSISKFEDSIDFDIENVSLDERAAKFATIWKNLAVAIYPYRNTSEAIPILNKISLYSELEMKETEIYGPFFSKLRGYEAIRYNLSDEEQIGTDFKGLDELRRNLPLNGYSVKKRTIAVVKSDNLTVPLMLPEVSFGYSEFYRLNKNLKDKIKAQEDRRTLLLLLANGSYVFKSPEFNMPIQNWNKNSINQMHSKIESLDKVEQCYKDKALECVKTCENAMSGYYKIKQSLQEYQKALLRDYRMIDSSFLTSKKEEIDNYKLNYNFESNIEDLLEETERMEVDFKRRLLEVLAKEKANVSINRTNIIKTGLMVIETILLLVLGYLNREEREFFHIAILFAVKDVILLVFDVKAKRIAKKVKTMNKNGPGYYYQANEQYLSVLFLFTEAIFGGVYYPWLFISYFFVAGYFIFCSESKFKYRLDSNFSRIFEKKYI